MIDVFPVFVEFVFVADDAVVVGTLPDRFAWCVAVMVDAFCDGRFERTDDNTQ